jgi:RHS repeat-associated protein
VIFDLHGSIAALCPAASSSLSDAYRYDAWGQAIGTNPGTATNPWRYRGLLDVSPDTSNPILSLGARFYSPQLGSFTKEDSVQGQAANPLSMNRYLYAEADPETLIDPDGHAVMTTLAGGCAYDPEDCRDIGWTSQTSTAGKR